VNLLDKLDRFAVFKSSVLRATNMPINIRCQSWGMGCIWRAASVQDSKILKRHRMLMILRSSFDKVSRNGDSILDDYELFTKSKIYALVAMAYQVVKCSQSISCIINV